MKENRRKNIPANKPLPSLDKKKITSIDGFNLAEFSLSPLTYQTKDLAHREISYEWEQNINGRKKKCYFKLSYGGVPPNADTEDYLLILLYLAKLKGKPLSAKTSFHEIMKTKGVGYKPNQQYIKSIIRHLDALMDLKIETNFIYNRETGRWNRGVKTRVISSYEYKTKEQQRTRYIQKIGNEESVKSIEDVHELERVNFDPLFYKYFIQDSISFDLVTYFFLENPTPKRLYRFGNKYAQNFGSFGLDLVHFCITRLGMKQSYVEGFKYISRLSSKLKPHINRVNETVEGLEIMIEKDKSQPSGYKIKFKETEQLKIPFTIEGFTKLEKKCYNTLTKNGIYPAPARQLITNLRIQLGRKSTLYIGYVLKMFKQYERKGLKVNSNQRGGVLLTAFDGEWYLPAFVEWDNKRNNAEKQEEIKRYGKEVLGTLFELNKTNEEEKNIKEKQINPSSAFDLESFKKIYNEVYQEIFDLQQNVSLKAKEIFGETVLTGGGKYTYEEGVLRRVEFYCKQCFDEFQSGNLAFFPKMNLGISDSLE